MTTQWEECEPAYCYKAGLREVPERLPEMYIQVLGNTFELSASRLWIDDVLPWCEERKGRHTWSERETYFKDDHTGKTRIQTPPTPLETHRTVTAVYRTSLRMKSCLWQQSGALDEELERTVRRELYPTIKRISVKWPIRPKLVGVKQEIKRL